MNMYGFIEVLAKLFLYYNLYGNNRFRVVNYNTDLYVTNVNIYNVRIVLLIKHL